MKLLLNVLKEEGKHWGHFLCGFRSVVIEKWKLNKF